MRRCGGTRETEGRLKSNSGRLGVRVFGRWWIACEKGGQYIGLKMSWLLEHGREIGIDVSC